MISISGELKEQAFCKLITPKPEGCQVDTGADDTNDIGTFEQPPLIMIHGTRDKTIPYVNGKAVYDRAQSVGLTSSLITI